MASSSGLPTPRRSKTMPTEGHMTKFLYSILKQLDLKPIDWGQVAADLEISNGHAARMRYSRFKQQMEGTVSVPRGPAKSKKTAAGKGDTEKGGKGAKLGKGGSEKEKRLSDDTTLASENASMEAPPPAYSKKRKASETLVESEPADSNNARRQQMAESSSSMLSTSSLPHGLPQNNNRMVPNGMMMMPFSNTNSSNPYSLPPLRSPMQQMGMNQDDVMMSHQPSSFPHHYHHHYHQQQQYPYGSFNADYGTDSFVNTPQTWHNSEYCFSGCCQPPPYPATPNMYPSYPTIAATTLSTSSNSTPLPFQQQQHQIHPQLLQQPQEVWVPVKQEGGEGVSDELLIKVETRGESEMRADE